MKAKSREIVLAKDQFGDTVVAKKRGKSVRLEIRPATDLNALPWYSIAQNAFDAFDGTKQVAFEANNLRIIIQRIY